MHFSYDMNTVNKTVFTCNTIDYHVVYVSFQTEARSDIRLCSD